MDWWLLEGGISANTKKYYKKYPKHITAHQGCSWVQWAAIKKSALSSVHSCFFCCCCCCCCWFCRWLQYQYWAVSVLLQAGLPVQYYSHTLFLSYFLAACLPLLLSFFFSQEPVLLLPVSLLSFFLSFFLPSFFLFVLSFSFSLPSFQFLTSPRYTPCLPIPPSLLKYLLQPTCPLNFLVFPRFVSICAPLVLIIFSWFFFDSFLPHFGVISSHQRLTEKKKKRFTSRSRFFPLILLRQTL